MGWAISGGPATAERESRAADISAASSSTELDRDDRQRASFGSVVLNAVAHKKKAVDAVTLAPPALDRWMVVLNVTSAFSSSSQTVARSCRTSSQEDDEPWGQGTGHRHAKNNQRQVAGGTERKLETKWTSVPSAVPLVQCGSKQSKAESGAGPSRSSNRSHARLPDSVMVTCL